MFGQGQSPGLGGDVQLHQVALKFLSVHPHLLT